MLKKLIIKGLYVTLKCVDFIWYIVSRILSQEFSILCEYFFLKNPKHFSWVEKIQRIPISFSHKHITIVCILNIHFYGLLSTDIYRKYYDCSYITLRIFRYRYLLKEARSKTSSGSKIGCSVSVPLFARIFFNSTLIGCQTSRLR